LWRGGAKKYRDLVWFYQVAVLRRTNAPTGFEALQSAGASRNVGASLGVLRRAGRNGTTSGEKNPWNLTRIMPPQGSVEVSRARRFQATFPPFLRSLFSMERT
jgi:hypothetical protein